MSEPLAFTGERFTPECVREIWYEHWHRYAFALPFARGRRVLDAACGEGYGSMLLARQAAHVTGVDISEQAVAHARGRYGNVANLAFEQGDACALERLPDASFDLVVSYETLEHVEAHEAMLAGFARVLKPDGLLLISSPDKRTYSDLTGFRNEHHVRELYRDEFEALLARHFSARHLFGQKLLFQSAIWSLQALPDSTSVSTAQAADLALADGFAYEPLYFIAACAKHASALPVGLHGRVALFGDRDESVYTHYNHEIRKNIQAGTLLADLERRLQESEARAQRAEANAGSVPPAGNGWLARLRRWLRA